MSSNAPGVRGVSGTRGIAAIGGNSILPNLPGTPFTEEDLGPEQQPWLELLDGRAPVWDGTAPTSYQTAPGWRSLLEFAAGPYAALQRGVARWAGVLGEREGRGRVL